MYYFFEVLNKRLRLVLFDNHHICLNKQKTSSTLQFYNKTQTAISPGKPEKMVYITINVGNVIYEEFIL